MRKQPLLEMTGELCIWSQEGGYADSSVLINQEPVADTLLAIVQDRNERFREGETGLVVRLVVEVVDREEGGESDEPI